MPRKRVERLGDVGLITDEVASLVPSGGFTRVFNAWFRDGDARSTWGERKIFDISIKPVWHFEYLDANGAQWIIVSDGVTVLAYTSSGLEYDITPLVETVPTFGANRVTFVDHNTILVVNSDTYGPYYWSGSTSTPLQPLPGWPSGWKCEFIGSYKYYLIALNMIESGALYPYKIRWSHAAAEGELPTEWVPDATNEAGDDLLGDTQGHIIGGTRVLDSFWIVKDSAVYSLDWIGGQYVLQTRLLRTDVGTNVPGGFCQMQGALVLAHQKDVVLFNGAAVQSLSRGKVRRALISAIGDAWWQATQVYAHVPTGVIFLCGAADGSAGELSNAMIYSMENGTWGHRSLGRSYGIGAAVLQLAGSGGGDLTWDDLAGPVPDPLPPTGWVPGLPWDQQTLSAWNQGSYDPDVSDIIIYKENDTGDAWWLSAMLTKQAADIDGEPIYTVMERVGLPIEGCDGIAMITDCWVDPVQRVPLVFRFGSQATPEAQVVWGPPVTLEAGQTYLDPRVSGRFLAYRIESTDTVGEWRIGALTFNWERDGER
jgi:hypothetical protein